MPIDDLSALIEQRTGLSAATRFRSDLEHILTQVAEGDLEGLFYTLKSNREDHPQWQAVLQALTIGETYFFRDEINFGLLRQRLLPELIQLRRSQHQLYLNIWSAGCASGEEPYSIAITLLELIPDLHQWTINLIGTDINDAALDHARRGVYREWAFRRSDPLLQKRYFHQVSGGWQIKPHVRQIVSFRQANLRSGPPIPQCDFIFCRNVLIYVVREQIPALESMFYQSLTSGGWLILGQAEAIRSHRERWMTHVFPGSVLYQKRLGTQPFTRHYRQPRLPGAAADSVPANGSSNAPDSQGDQYETALAALHDDQPDEAERVLCEILDHQPNHAPAHTLLAYIFANRQAVPEAQSHLDAALKSNSMWGDAHYLRAALHLENDRLEEAERSLRAALYCQRDHTLATFMMGNLFAKAGDTQRARRAWQAACDLVSALPPDKRVSDLSDMTAATFASLIVTQVNSLNGQG